MNSRIIPIILVIGSIALFALYVHPTYTQSIATLSGEIKGYDAVLASAKRFKEKQSDLSAQKSAIPLDQLARLEAFLPDTVDNVQLILDLNALAARSGVSLSDLDVALPEKKDEQIDGSGRISLTGQNPIETLEVSLSITGSYGAFRTFLAAAENSLRPLDIVEIVVTDEGAEAAAGTHNYDVTFRIYWLR
ncbi:MAG: putative pilO [Parcubacteria bacterium C7867-004]|nr:MAG: putative pilO [Parcubacteria bacterium C7867-004]